MYSRLSELAADNPDAWAEDAVSAAHIREHSATNRMLAFPYTKLHNSQWNVDQAAGLILCSAEVAEELGLRATSGYSRWRRPSPISCRW